MLKQRLRQHDSVLADIQRHKSKTLKLHKKGERSVAALISLDPKADQMKKSTLSKKSTQKIQRTKSTLLEQTNLLTSSKKISSKFRMAGKKVVKNILQKKRIALLIRSSPIFTELLSKKMINILIDGSESREYENGTWLFKQGELGDGMYIVQEGKVELYKKKKVINQSSDKPSNNSDNDDDNDDESIEKYNFHSSLSIGALFGEKSMVLNAPREICARCAYDELTTTCSVIFIPKKLYQSLSKTTLSTNLLKIKQNILKNGIMDRVECFNDLSKEQKSRLLDVMRHVIYKKGDYICTQGEPGSTLHIIVQGTVRVTINDKKSKCEKDITILGPDKYFGEIALLSDDCKRTANVIADTMDEIDNETHTMMLHKLNFDQFIKGDIRENMEQNALHTSNTNHLNHKEIEKQNEKKNEKNKKVADRNGGGGGHLTTKESIKMFQKSYNFIDLNVIYFLNVPMTIRILKLFLSNVDFQNYNYNRHKSILTGRKTNDKRNNSNNSNNDNNYNNGNNHNGGGGSIGSNNDNTISNSDNNNNGNNSNNTPATSTTVNTSMSIYASIGLTPAEENKIKMELAQLLRLTLRKEIGTRSDHEILFLIQILKNTNLYKIYCNHWNVKQISDFVQHGLYYEAYERGKPLFHVGRPANYSYFIMSGLVEMTSDRSFDVKRNADSNGDIHLVGAGDIVGEMALQGVRNRLHSCYSKIPSQVIVIDVAFFMKITENAPNFKFKYNLLRSKTRLLKDWPNDMLFRLAFNFFEKRIRNRKQIITNIGQIPTGLHIVLEGSVGVYVPDHSSKKRNTWNCLKDYKLVTLLGPGEIFDTCDLLAKATSKSFLLRSPDICKSTVQIISETNSLRFLELPSQHYSVILQSGLPTIQRLYALECQRNILYNKCLKDWSISMNHVDTIENKAVQELKHLKNSIQLEYNKKIMNQRQRSPSFNSSSHSQSRIPSFSPIKHGTLLRSIKSQPQILTSDKLLISNPELFEILPRNNETTESNNHKPSNVSTLNINKVISTSPASWWDKESAFYSSVKSSVGRNISSAAVVSEEGKRRNTPIMQHARTNISKPFTARTPSRSKIVRDTNELRGKNLIW